MLNGLEVKAMGRGGFEPPTHGDATRTLAI